MFDSCFVNALPVPSAKMTILFFMRAPLDRMHFAERYRAATRAVKSCGTRALAPIQNGLSPHAYVVGFDT
jgi:hypothetical protein